MVNISSRQVGLEGSFTVVGVVLLAISIVYFVGGRARSATKAPVTTEQV